MRNFRFSRCFRFFGLQIDGLRDQCESVEISKCILRGGGLLMIQLVNELLQKLLQKLRYGYNTCSVYCYTNSYFKHFPKKFRSRLRRSHNGNIYLHFCLLHRRWDINYIKVRSVIIYCLRLGMY